MSDSGGDVVLNCARGTYQKQMVEVEAAEANGSDEWSE